MALIKCPECQKEISDKSKQCIHCGCPLENNDYTIIVNGITYEVPEFYEALEKYKKEEITRNRFAQIISLGSIKFNLSNKCSNQLMFYILDNLKIPKEFNGQTKEEYLKEKSKPHCPKCNSTATEATTRGYSAFWGLLGSGKTMNYCKNCGHKWNP